ncbi:MAG: ATP-binding protein [Acidimicrobiaceae bacterium]|nr:ATP-binding protein [Acidimicrobiaceae bacterium]MDE0515048.1 ATP-binding protein [Acidimicrobiaceae bacterium]
MAEEENLAARLVQARSPETAVETVLRTSDRVLARITDGIYRQPGSALRELLANAYDADATHVTVTTDRPRFRTIRVEDNGIGMSPDMIEYVLENIGGSSKRVTAGTKLGITHKTNPNLSPGGRRLIGKIGIGLFSVSQLARSFHIVTKQEDDDYYSIIRFLLKHYADGDEEDETGQYEAGLALLWQERAEERSAHGTTVVLNPVRPEATNRLQSADEWELLDAHEENQRRQPPTFHIGRLRSGFEDQLASLNTEADKYTSLPWENEDDASTAFKKLIQAIERVAGESQNNTKLEGICDRYLRMVWDLALALPLPYVDIDPIHHTLDESIHSYELRNGRAIALPTGEAERLPIARSIGVTETHASGSDEFRVVLDDLELARPLTFADFPRTQRARQDPLLLCERVSEAFEDSPSQLSGGPLEFHAYLLWAPKLVPRDRAGALVRIHGSSGTGFDDGFLRYQTREKIRIGQTSCEIFVTKGLEGALNIDRESFNYAHPHVIYLSKWLHDALTQLFSEEKRLSSDVRKETRSTARVKKDQALHRVAQDVWDQEVGTDEAPPRIEFIDDGPENVSDEEPIHHTSDHYELRRPEVRSPMEGKALEPTANTAELEAIFQVLASFGLVTTYDASQGSGWVA